MKKTLALLLAVALCLALCACGTTAPVPTKQPTSAPTGEPVSEPVTLTYWNFTATDMPIENDLIAQFQDTHPGIIIDLVNVSTENFHDKILLAAETGTAPDVYQSIPEWTSDLWESGFLTDISADVADVADTYLPDALGLVEWKDATIGLPFRYGTSGVFINTKLFADAGIEVPANWTWQEFFDIAKQLTDVDSEVYGYAIPGSNSDLALSWNAMTFTFQGGGGFIENGKAVFNDAGSVAGLDYIKSMWDAGILPASTGSLTQSDVVDMFGAGKVAMFTNGPWYASTVKASYPDMEFTTAMLPTDPDHPDAVQSVCGGTYMTVNGQSEHYAEAVEFIKFLTSEESMRQWAGAGEFLPTVSALMDDDCISPLVKPFAEQAKLGTICTGATVENTNLLEIYQNEVMQAINGTKSSQDALDAAAAGWNEVLAKY